MILSAAKAAGIRFARGLANAIRASDRFLMNTASGTKSASRLTNRSRTGGTFCCFDSAMCVWRVAEDEQR